MSSDRREGPPPPYEDVSPLSSDASEIDSDDDPIARNARSSIEITKHDHELLREEEERENLLNPDKNRSTPSRFFDRTFGNKEKRAQKERGKRKHHGANDEEGELMYEMEEGGPHSDVSSQASMSSIALDKLNISRQRPSRVCTDAMHCSDLRLIHVHRNAGLRYVQSSPYPSLSSSSPSRSLPIEPQKGHAYRLALSCSLMAHPNLHLQPFSYLLTASDPILSPGASRPPSIALLRKASHRSTCSRAFQA